MIKGDVFLRDGFAATGAVRLLGAQIGGGLDCSGAKFDGKDGDALSADRAVIKGNVFLCEGFAATGAVRLPGAQIGGSLDCSGAKFDGKDGYALIAEGMVAEGNFIFRNLVSPVSAVNLSASHVGRLVDDARSWGEWLVLDGFTYGSISGGAPTDAATRLAWLDKQPISHAGLNGAGADFRPQPWRQLARVLREMGHAEDARQVAIAFEDRLREANLIGRTPKHWVKPFAWLYRKVSRGGHALFGVLTGYGYRPLHLMFWMFAVWLLCAAVYWYAALAGVFAPSSPPVLQNPGYAVCAPNSIEAAYMRGIEATACPATSGAGNWSLCEKLHENYPGFSPLVYSLDILLPPVDLQQKKSWAPLIRTSNGAGYQGLAIPDLNHITRWVLWYEILFGWVSSLLLVAVVSGLTKRREE